MQEKHKAALAAIRAEMTIMERLEVHAIEARDLCDIVWATSADSFQKEALSDIEDREYNRAISKATGNYEPPDDTDAWSGGFADNH